MNDATLRITTIDTAVLARQLDCHMDATALDAALDDAGYVRLDHGTDPGPSTAIMEVERAVGLDPGHRAPAIMLMRSLCSIVHADGPPTRDRLMACAETALSLSWTDSVGESVIEAAAAYAVRNDPGDTVIDPSMAERHGVDELARRIYAVTRNNNVVTDVAFARAMSAGALIEGWKDALWRAKPVEEPIVMARRHDASEYEALGIEPRLAEIMAWVKAHPDVDTERFTRYAQLVGMTSQEAARSIADAVERLATPQIETEKGTPSSTS